MPEHMQTEQILQRSRLCSGLAAEEIEQVAKAVRRVSFRNGEAVCRQGDHGDTMYIVAQGRLKVTVSRGGGDERLVDFLTDGDHFGEMAMLAEGDRTASVTAVTDSLLLELGTDDFHLLMAELPGFAANLGRTLCARLRRETSGRQAEKHVGRLAVLQTTPRCREVVPLMVSAIGDYGKSVAVLSDRASRWPAREWLHCESISETFGGSSSVDAEYTSDLVGRLRRRGDELFAECDHLMLDVGTGAMKAAATDLLADFEQIWIVVEAACWDENRRRLEALFARAPKLAPKTHIVWVLADDERFAPAVELPAGIASRDFKVVISDDPSRGTIYQTQGITRLLRFIYGKRIGLALSGGGARGLAHLGALRVFDREGISFDSIAGTSAGALMGLSYSGGWEPDDALAKFQRDLTPGWLFRRLPAGNRWYMLGKYRTGAWDRMLRGYAPEVRLEQLRIPLSTVTVDLVSGKQVVRDRGDAIHAVLESLNLPMIARPIVRDGMALVDGGVLNNLPANLLPERGASLVVGVDISRGLSPTFAGIGPGANNSRRRGPGPMETIMRLTDVQAHEVTALQSHAVDLMVGIDTSAFDFADFTKGDPLAEVGEQATVEVIPQLKEMLQQQRVP